MPLYDLFEYEKLRRKTTDLSDIEILDVTLHKEEPSYSPPESRKMTRDDIADLCGLDTSSRQHTPFSFSGRHFDDGQNFR